jgi:hypothetical protein
MTLAGRSFIALTLILILADISYEYPVDGYDETGIRRLERLRIRLEGNLKGPVPVMGGRKSISVIKLNFVDTLQSARKYFNDQMAFLKAPLKTSLPSREDFLSPQPGLKTALDTLQSSLGLFPSPDPELQQEIERLFSNRDKNYSLAILDITPGGPVRYAALRSKNRYAPGSVGKLAIGAGLFAELKRLYPNSIEERRKLLRTRMIKAGEWIRVDEHKVPLFNVEDSSVGFRPIREGDIFSLYEWADHTLSASSNAAASTLWKEVILMRAYGDRYPPTPEEEELFFDRTPKEKLREIALSVVNDPLRRAGIAEDQWQLGTFFTSAGKRIVPRGGNHGTPNGLLLFLVRLEQGRVVDEWSSLELKRLMYMTEKRIRYASSPRLNNCAVYFKSGSLYRCQPEAGFKCGKYMGNLDNYMNSVAIVERPDGRIYMAVIMSNVLRKNSAVEHQTLATFIDRIIEKT